MSHESVNSKKTGHAGAQNSSAVKLPAITVVRRDTKMR
jgi:hypothetical protein